MTQLGRSAGLTGFLDVARQVGLDAYQLARSAGLPPDALTDPDLQVSVEAMGRMYELAADQSGLDDFALRVAERRRFSNLGVIGLVVREQPTVRHALQTYARYQWLQNSAYALSMQEIGDQAILRIDGPVWRQRQGAELAVTATLKTLQALLGGHWRPQEVWLTHDAPPRLDSYRRVLGLTPLFDQDCVAIVIDRTDLDARIATADPAIAREVARQLERLTQSRRTELSDQVSQLVVALLPDGACSVERVAQHLGMDRRTLHRRLAAEGVTYSDLLDRVRREMAASLLTRSDRPMQSVADLLGFSSLSAFAHWFRRHFDQSATAYRAANAGAAIARPPEPLLAVVELHGQAALCCAASVDSRRQ